VRGSLKRSEPETTPLAPVDGGQPKPKRPRNWKRKPRLTDTRLISRLRTLENQPQGEKAVSHQAHMEINRLNHELRKEKAENARLNADLCGLGAREMHSSNRSVRTNSETQVKYKLSLD